MTLSDRTIYKIYLFVLPSSDEMINKTTVPHEIHKSANPCTTYKFYLTGHRMSEYVKNGGRIFCGLGPGQKKNCPGPSPQRILPHASRRTTFTPVVPQTIFPRVSRKTIFCRFCSTKNISSCCSLKNACCCSPKISSASSKNRNMSFPEEFLPRVLVQNHIWLGVVRKNAVHPHLLRLNLWANQLRRGPLLLFVSHDFCDSVQTAVAREQVKSARLQLGHVHFTLFTVSATEPTGAEILGAHRPFGNTGG